MSKEAERYTVTIHLAAPGTPRVYVGDAGQKRLLIRHLLGTCSFR